MDLAVGVGCADAFVAAAVDADDDPFHGRIVLIQHFDGYRPGVEDGRRAGDIGGFDLTGIVDGTFELPVAEHQRGGDEP